MRRTVPEFVEPRFQVVGSRNPVGVLTLVLSPKEFESMRVAFLEEAPGLEQPQSSRRLVGVQSFPGYPNLRVEIEISPEGWEILYLRNFCVQRILNGPSASEDSFWFAKIGEATKAGVFVWEGSDEELQQRGLEWLHSLSSSLRRFRLPHVSGKKRRPKRSQ